MGMWRTPEIGQRRPGGFLHAIAEIKGRRIAFASLIVTNDTFAEKVAESRVRFSPKKGCVGVCRSKTVGFV
mgnify:CR=1